MEAPTRRDTDDCPAMRSAVSIIRGEHLAFATALHALERYLAPAIEQGLKPNHDLFGTILAYIERFTDRFHHPKEDEHLFRSVRARTDRADAALLDLQHDHATGAARLQTLHESLRRAQSGSGADLADFAGRLRRYIAGQEAHMRKEHEIVIPIARETLTPGDWEMVDLAFRDNRDPLFGTGPDGSVGYLFRRAREAPDP
ncbi:MAG: hemerythrin domain-containing protein [Betaproteobacteria bacterium]|nr:hemerythrin domain-containing protein [Betaproteobacteria bacterium]